MKIEKLSMDHRALLSKQFSRLQLNISEYSFANLYLFRDLHEYEVVFNSEYFVQGKKRNGSIYLMPTSHPESWPDELMSELSLQGASLYPIPQEWLVYFEKHMTEYCFCEGESDYIFYTNKLANYSGRRLSKKRNLVKQLLQGHHVKVDQIFVSDCNELFKVLEDWQTESELTIEKSDYLAVEEAIRLMDALHLSGLKFEVDGKTKGFVIGEWLNPSCYVLHFAKADREIHGLYQYLYQCLAQSIEKQAEYINLEQDLGILSLRRAKHSYQPAQLVHKYLVNMRSGL